MGDFLAGIFAPLAFFWLVIGYFQQSHELAQNSAALRVQADELRNQVSESQRLVDAAQNQTKEMIAERLAREAHATPRVQIGGWGNARAGSIPWGAKVWILGAELRDLKIEVDGCTLSSASFVPVIKEEEKIGISLTLTTKKPRFSLEYRDVLGRKYWTSLGIERPSGSVIWLDGHEVSGVKNAEQMRLGSNVPFVAELL